MGRVDWDGMGRSVVAWGGAERGGMGRGGTGKVEGGARIAQAELSTACLYLASDNRKQATEHTSRPTTYIPTPQHAYCRMHTELA
eukprot:356396-Chlamydomonas_euryale.AAC.10